jgi:hypothetical protein
MKAKTDEGHHKVEDADDFTGKAVAKARLE